MEPWDMASSTQQTLVSGHSSTSHGNELNSPYFDLNMVFLSLVPFHCLKPNQIVYFLLKTLVVSENKEQQNKQAIKETHNKKQNVNKSSGIAVVVVQGPVKMTNDTNCRRTILGPIIKDWVQDHQL